MEPGLGSGQYLYLTTRGHKTGLPREIEIWFTRHGPNFYVIAEYPASHWVRNVQAHPEVQVRVNDHRFSARARVLSAQADSALIQPVQQLSRDKYGWGEGLVVELVPAQKSD